MAYDYDSGSDFMKEYRAEKARRWWRARHIKQALSQKDIPLTLEDFEYSKNELCRRFKKKQGTVIFAKNVLEALQEPHVEVPKALVELALRFLREAKVGQKRLVPKIMEAAGIEPERPWYCRPRYKQNRYAPRQG